MLQEKRGQTTQIKEYVLEHTGLTVSSLYIAQVKQKCGIIEREIKSSEVWDSPVTPMHYPTRWQVEISEWDAVLDVKSIMDEQEIVAGDPAGRKYEGASRFKGIYRGKEVTGWCCLELVGGWDK